jgi:hypothetical protein
MVIGTDADLRCWVEQFRDLKPLTPCMPCSFGLLPHPRSEPRAQLNDPLRVTVTVRWLPLVTAAYGTRVARPARTTWLGAAAMGSSFSAGGGPSRATRASLASARRVRGSRVDPPISTPGHAAVDNDAHGKALPDGPNRIPEGVVASRNEDREQIAGRSRSWVTPSEQDESRLLFEGLAAQLKSGGVKRRGGRGRRRLGAVAEQDAVGRRGPP